MKGAQKDFLTCFTYLAASKLNGGVQAATLPLPHACVHQCSHCLRLVRLQYVLSNCCFSASMRHSQTLFPFAAWSHTIQMKHRKRNVLLSFTLITWEMFVDRIYRVKVTTICRIIRLMPLMRSTFDGTLDVADASFAFADSFAVRPRRDFFFGDSFLAESSVSESITGVVALPF